MHDRRIDGVVHTFGNAGSLFMYAMTWWDHETHSIWSQPWGRAIIGEYKGIQLDLLPSQVTTWGNWRKTYPQSQVMINDAEILEYIDIGFQPNFVIGLVLRTESKAYYYKDVFTQGVINDTLGDVPVMIWADEKVYQAYVRIVDERTLTFALDGDELVDEETESRWDPDRGRAISGPLAGSVLQPVPSLSSFDWAWVDFYPNSEFYVP